MKYQATVDVILDPDRPDYLTYTATADFNGFKAFQIGETEEEAVVNLVKDLDKRERVKNVKPKGYPKPVEVETPS